jgi:hypothetical protein
LATILKNVDEKLLATILKNIDEKKYWQCLWKMLRNYRQLFRKMLTKKCWYHLQKMLTKKCCNISKNVWRSLKREKCCPTFFNNVATFKNLKKIIDEINIS